MAHQEGAVAAEVNMKTQNTILTVSIALIVLFLISTFSNQGYGYGMMGMMGFGYNPFMALFGWVFMLLILIALILFIIWLVNQLQPRKR